MLKKENNLQNKEIQQLTEIVRNYETQLEKAVHKQHQHTEGFIVKNHNRSHTELEDDGNQSSREYRHLSPRPTSKIMIKHAKKLGGTRYKTPEEMSIKSPSGRSPLSNSPMFEELLRDKRNKSSFIQGINDSDSKRISILFLLIF